MTPEYIALSEHLEKHFDKRFEELKMLLADAVPEGDLHAHKAAHISWMKEAEDRREFRQRVLIELAKGTAWAALVALATAFWFWFKSQVTSK